MKRKPKRSKRREQVIPVWTHAQAVGAMPYLTSIVRSLRDHRLDAVRHDRTAKRLASQFGRPNRHNLIAHQEEFREAQIANDRFQDALQELHELGIYCLDPIRGEALIPFINEQQLAWYVFDLFDPHPLRFWRLHTDSLETRRPLADAREGEAEGPIIV
jgi:hypothetical protein